MTRTRVLFLLSLCGCASAAATPNPGIPAVGGETKEIRGVRYIDVAQGTGEPVAANRCLYVQYVGWLEDGHQFDTSRDSTAANKARPVAFVEGTHQVIDGWEIGVEGMRAGGFRRLFIPYRLGYGEAGHRPHIPGRANLTFDLELMAVTASLEGPRGTRVCPPWEEARPQ
jgi:FKBP-type peptidyl-prolyl cis-trans isomerase